MSQCNNNHFLILLLSLPHISHVTHLGIREQLQPPVGIPEANPQAQASPSHVAIYHNLQAHGYSIITFSASKRYLGTVGSFVEDL